MYARRRHDISDRVWENIQAHLPDKKGGSTPKYIRPRMRMACRSELPLQKVPELIARKRAHCIDGLSAKALLADPGYDSNELTDKAVESGCQPVIPPRKNRREQRDYDKALYRVRHLVENAFLHPKRWRGIATRIQNGNYLQISRQVGLKNPAFLNSQQFYRVPNQPKPAAKDDRTFTNQLRLRRQT